MAYKIGKITQATRLVKTNVPDGEDVRKETTKVGMQIFPNTEQTRLRQALLDAGSKDVDLDFLKKHAITSIEGPEFDDGSGPLSLVEALDVPYIRTAIDTEYQMICAGVVRKN